MLTRLNQALALLTEKYSVRAGEIIKNDGNYLVDKTPLLPWRVERRFIELKSTFTSGTLEDVSTLRFSSMTAGENLMEQVACELDLATWMMEAPIISLFAVCSNDAVANIIAKLANGISLSIECSNKLPPGAERIDCHEIIARRGIASDRVVDTQVPQSSIYTFTVENTERYTDGDAELFGLIPREISIVRAALAVLKQPNLGAEWTAARRVTNELMVAVKESHGASCVVKLQGGVQ